MPARIATGMRIARKFPIVFTGGKDRKKAEPQQGEDKRSFLSHNTHVIHSAFLNAEDFFQYFAKASGQLLEFCLMITESS